MSAKKSGLLLLIIVPVRIKVTVFFVFNCLVNVSQNKVEENLRNQMVLLKERGRNGIGAAILLEGSDGVDLFPFGEWASFLFFRRPPFKRSIHGLEDTSVLYLGFYQ